MVNTTNASTSYENKVLHNVLLEHIRDQRRARRWNIFFKLVLIGFLVAFLIAWFSKDMPQPLTTQAHAAVIDIKGEIGMDQESNADDIRDALRKAFDNKLAKGIVLRINSPGGSPVQARQVYDEIRRLKIKHPETRVYAAIEDLGTSAAYLIAVAADEIYSDKTSLVGSIGVKIDSFGFVDGMHKVGVERRMYVAGKYKGILDPFSPTTPETNTFINNQLEMVHQVFINNVREGRGNRLRETPEMFSGLFWTGEQALTLGLTDGFGDARHIAREIFKVDNVVDYTTSVSFFDKLTRKIGASISQALLSQSGFIARGVR